MNRKRIVILIAAVLLAITALGLWGIYGPMKTSAWSRVDDSCMAALKKRGVPYDTRLTRCSVKIKRETSMLADAGSAAWSVENFLWKFHVNAYWNTSTTVVGGTVITTYSDISVECWKEFVRIIDLRIPECKAWQLGMDWQVGAHFETAFGPVTEGWRTYKLLLHDGTTVGPITGR